MLAMSEALRTENGAIVVDLNLDNSTANPVALQAGYAVYDAKNSSVTRLILFNYASEQTQFTLPATLFADSSIKTALVKFLASSGANATEVSWGGKTFAGVGDGKSAVNAPWVTTPNQNLECTNGCSFNASRESMAMVFLDNAQFDAISGPTSSQASPAPTQASNGAFHVSSLSLGGFYTVVVLGLFLL
jgi:hypothetical protein